MLSSPNKGSPVHYNSLTSADSDIHTRWKESLHCQKLEGSAIVPDDAQSALLRPEEETLQFHPQHRLKNTQSGRNDMSWNAHRQKKLRLLQTSKYSLFRIPLHVHDIADNAPDLPRSYT